MGTANRKFGGYGDELVIMRSIRKLLQLLRPASRKVVVDWINIGWEEWPTTDRNGKVVDDTPPPLLGYIEEQKGRAAGAGDGTAAAV